MRHLTKRTNYKNKKISRKINLLITKLARNPINVYWFDKTPNFGDLLTPELLRFYGLTPIHAPRQDAQLLLIGSVLDKVSENYSGIIMGSGLMYDQPKSFPNANIVAVRGKLTKERIGAPDSVLLGDPGLLADRLIDKRSKRTFKLGIVLHFVDQKDERITRILENAHQDILFIDVLKKPRKVIREIDKCDYILSSSLHGLVTADSLGIPNGWINLSDRVLGHGFKFLDYSSSINKIIEPNSIDGSESLDKLVKLTRPVSKEVLLVKEDLHFAFTRLREIVDSWFPGY